MIPKSVLYIAWKKAQNNAIDYSWSVRLPE